MPQPVAIQTEILPAVSAPKLANKGANSDKAAFSEALDAHMSRDQGAETSAVAKEGNIADPQKQAAKSDQAEKRASDDEQNLPADTADNVKSEKGVAEEAIDTDLHGEVSNTEVVTVEVSTTSEQEAENVINSAVAVVSDETESDDTLPDETEVSIRAQVTVAEPAVTHAQAAPVEMTVKDKAKPEQVSVNNPVKQTAPSAVAAANMAEPKAQTVANTVSTSTQEATDKVTKIPLDIKTLTTPEKSTVSAESEKGGSQTQIRADLMDALKRQPQQPMMTEKVKQAMLTQNSEQSQKANTPAVALVAGRVPELPAQSSANVVSPIFSAAATNASTAPSNASQTPLLSLPVQPNMQQVAWSKVMSSRVVWMAKEGIQQAELRMNPANLGPVEVRLQVQNDQTNVTFLAQQTATREALEQALPKLREQFADAGLALGNAEVGSQTQEQHETDDSEEAMIFSQANDRLDDTNDKENKENKIADASTGISVYA